MDGLIDEGGMEKLELSLILSRMIRAYDLFRVLVWNLENLKYILAEGYRTIYWGFDGLCFIAVWYKGDF